MYYALFKFTAPFKLMTVMRRDPTAMAFCTERSTPRKLMPSVVRTLSMRSSSSMR